MKNVQYNSLDKIMLIQQNAETYKGLRGLLSTKYTHDINN